MTIRVRYFASLREQVGRGDEQRPWREGLTVAQVWADATGGLTPPAHLLAAINRRHTSFEAVVRDGDEVAFFPPVTGG